MIQKLKYNFGQQGPTPVKSGKFKVKSVIYEVETTPEDFENTDWDAAGRMLAHHIWTCYRKAAAIETTAVAASAERRKAR